MGHISNHIKAFARKVLFPPRKPVLTYRERVKLTAVKLRKELARQREIDVSCHAAVARAIGQEGA